VDELWVSFPTGDEGGSSEVYYPTSLEELLSLKIKQSSLVQPVIVSSDDLIFLIVRIIQKLLKNDPQHLNDKVVQLIAELRAPLDSGDGEDLNFE